MTGSPLSPRAALDEVLGCEAWAVVRVKDSSAVTLVGGPRSEVGALMDVPLEQGPPPAGKRFDRLLAVPFRQVRERGFAAHDDGAPLTVVDVQVEHEVPFADLLAELPDVPVTFADRGSFETSDEDYAGVVRTIIDEEIGN